MNNHPSEIYHVTTLKKAKKYKMTKHIIAPVRGFNTLQAAMAWAIKTGRKIIYRIDCSEIMNKCHKLPDHHNEFGEAWWIDCNVSIEKIKCAFSGQEAEIKNKGASK